MNLNQRTSTAAYVHMPNQRGRKAGNRNVLDLRRFMSQDSMQVPEVPPCRLHVCGRGKGTAAPQRKCDCHRPGASTKEEGG